MNRCVPAISMPDNHKEFSTTGRVAECACKQIATAASRAGSASFNGNFDYFAADNARGPVVIGKLSVRKGVAGRPFLLKRFTTG